MSRRPDPATSMVQPVGSGTSAEASENLAQKSRFPTSEPSFQTAFPIGEATISLEKQCEALQGPRDRGAEDRPSVCVFVKPKEPIGFPCVRNRHSLRRRGHTQQKTGRDCSLQEPPPTWVTVIIKTGPASPTPAVAMACATAFNRWPVSQGQPSAQSGSSFQ
jgi:hypothetical protein